ncbi:hypothetical protein C8J56DRAFT_188681 [Mycena floridula]|nr:hypothetical protein C8J56DRAFT_188681 [Mycena floridula]
MTAMSVIDNGLFMKELKFGSGTAVLNYYLYNSRTASFGGALDEMGVSMKAVLGSLCSNPKVIIYTMMEAFCLSLQSQSSSHALNHRNLPTGCRTLLGARYNS